MNLRGAGASKGNEINDLMNKIKELMKDLNTEKGKN